jgi:addiction module RelE/StbE family toxin
MLGRAAIAMTRGRSTHQFALPAFSGTAYILSLDKNQDYPKEKRMGLLDHFENGLAELIRNNLKDAQTRRSLSTDELAAVEAAANGLEKEGIATFAGLEDLANSLGELWTTGLHPKVYRDRAIKELLDALNEAGISPMLDLSWKIGMSDDFIKSVESIDKKIQGRILEAISKLSRAPTKPVGDTVKPLTGNLAGLWRYRIGDYRLVYQPEPATNCVVLIRFTPRGGAYD